MSYLYQEINFSQFCDAFQLHDRQNQFSYGGKRALYDYILDLAESSGLPFELDVIALCTGYVEYESIEDFHEDHDQDEYPDIEAIKREAAVIRVGKTGFITEQF